MVLEYNEVRRIVNYRLTLPIEPYPRVLSAKVFKIKGQLIAKVHPTHRTDSYQKDLEKLLSIAWKQPPLTGPLRMFVLFYLPRPKDPKASKERRPYPIVTPDIDNLVKALLDPMTKCRVWVDDSQVVSLTAQKRYADGEPSKIEILLEKIVDAPLFQATSSGMSSA